MEENQKEIELKKLENFIKQLRELYTTKRTLLQGVAENELDGNEDFNVCMKIAAILASINSTRASFETFFILVKEQCEYNVDKLLSLFEIKWKEEKGMKIPELVPKEDEQIQ